MIDDDGRFEIVAPVERPPDAANWLPMAPETSMIQVRQTRVDHRNEVLAQVGIERVDAQPTPRPVTPQRLERSLGEVAFFVQATSQLFAQWTEDFRRRPNELPPLRPREGPRRRRRPEHRLLPRLVRPGARRGPGGRPHPARVRLLELPARQLLDGEPRLPLLPGAPQPWHRHVPA
ncbi:MAG: hypothetical protein M5U19_20885 [Microthrixaceae bacterium]|nr:hypothetical protein [Microthrixaceae bacterium]